MSSKKKQNAEQKPGKPLQDRRNIPRMNWIQSKWILVAAAGLYLTMGLCLVPHFNISWDEYIERDYGRKVLDFVLGKNNALFTHIGKFYGPVVPSLMGAIERLTGVSDTRSIYLQRHTINFLITWGGGVVLMGMMARILGSNVWGLVGLLFWIISPRQFAEGFYNSKDIPFMVATLWAMASAYWVLESGKKRSVILHAFLCALVTDIRIMGLAVPGITCLGFGYQLIRSRNSFPSAATTFIWKVGLFLVVFAGFTVLMWPTLWPDPLHYLPLALKEMSHYPWIGPVLFGGKYISSLDLPLRYIPVWMGISIPILYLGLAGIGVFKSVKQPSLVTTLHVGFIGLTFLALWLVRPVLYDGWRQVYFVYPSVLVLAVFGFKYCVEWANKTGGHLMSVGVGLVTTLSLVGVAVGMVANHPNQQVYFNAFAGDPTTLRYRYECDYWGLSYGEGLRFVLDNDSSPRIPVYVANAAGIESMKMLHPSSRSRLVVVADPKKARYFLTNYRWHPATYPMSEVFTVNAYGIPILSVYTSPKSLTK